MSIMQGCFNFRLIVSDCTICHMSWEETRTFVTYSQEACGSVLRIFLVHLVLNSLYYVESTLAAMPAKVPKKKSRFHQKH